MITSLSDLSIHQVFTLDFISYLTRAVFRNIYAEGTYYLLLGVTLIMGLAMDIIRRRNLKERYFTAGFRTDAIYAFFALNHLPSLFIVAPFSIAAAAIFTSAFPHFSVTYLTFAPVWVQLLIAFVFKDLWQYWYHRAQHASPWLWQIHKIHHSQEHLSVLSNFRFTIVDLLVATVLQLPSNAASGGLTLPFWIYIIYLLRSNLEHSDTGWTYGRLGKYIVSPYFHETHHSILPEHWDKNFSIVFSFWDRLFGTYAERSPAQLKYGLVDSDVPESFFAQIFVPFIGWAKLLRASYQKWIFLINSHKNRARQS